MLAPEARSDLRDILLYTAKQWGKPQQRVYREQLDAAFARIAGFPNLGIPRSDLDQGIRTYRVGQHVVIYQHTATEVLIVRILHARRDLAAEFEGA
ncbi:MAG: type II toxin-antitoxin system RelE/ParE family toxin [Solirubrobacterales bacterium]|nr:type II toxin-antitoxin system RelE/ParE family toxin [Solirubrobacterales bacterium]